MVRFKAIGYCIINISATIKCNKYVGNRYDMLGYHAVNKMLIILLLHLPSHFPISSSSDRHVKGNVVSFETVFRRSPIHLISIVCPCRSSLKLSGLIFRASRSSSVYFDSEHPTEKCVMLLYPSQDPTNHFILCEILL